MHPHVVTYYDQYAAPYVEIAQPYAERIHENVYVPVKQYTQDKYYEHGDQHVKRAITYVQDEWDRVAGPKVREVADTVRNKYVTVVEPSAQQMLEASAPYQEAALTLQSKAKYHAGHIATFYAEKYNQFVKPYVAQGLVKGQEYAVVAADKAVPYSKQALSAAVGFWTETVRPRITGLYSQNIEPQLVKIGRKLATYREARGRRANITDATSLKSDDEPLHTSTSYVASYSSVPPIEDSQTQTASYVAPPVVAASSTFSQPAPAQTVQRNAADDLIEWETKFANSVDKGSAELLKQISDIVDQKRASNPIEHANSLVEDLNERITSQFDGVKSTIIDLIASLPENTSPEDHDAALEALQDKIKSAGLDIKSTAQLLREYITELIKSLLNEVMSATNKTLDVISNIQILGIEQIGMKWAWMENVSYEDWTKYNALKNAEPTWKNDVRDIAILHEGLIKLRREADGVLAVGMDAMEKAAAELKELHEIGKWKILAEDKSEEFEVREEAPEAVRSERRKQLGLDLEETRSESEEEAVAGGHIDIEPPQQVMDAFPPEVPEEEEVVASNAENVDASSAIPTTDVPSPISSSSSVAIPSSDSHSEISDILGDPWEPTTEILPSTTTSSSAAPPSETIHHHTSVWGGVAAAELDPDSISARYASQTDLDNEEPPANINAALESEKARDVEDFIAQSPSPSPSPAPTSTGGATVPEPMMSQASAQFNSALLAATEALSAAIEQATGGPVVLDAKRRYYEAVGHAHDAFSSAIAEPGTISAAASSAIVDAYDEDEGVTATVSHTSTNTKTSTTTTTTAAAATAAADITAPEDEFESISSMIAASLDAVLYSISSVTVDAASTQSVVADAKSRYSAAMAAASSSSSSLKAAAEEKEKLGRRSTFSPPSRADETGMDGEPVYTILPVSEGAASVARDEL